MLCPPPLPLSDIKGPAALTPRKRARAHIVSVQSKDLEVHFISGTKLAGKH